MTAKEFVISRFPNAKSEKQISGRVKGMQSKYYLIRDGKKSMYMASGETESKAWKKVKERIIERETVIIPSKEFESWKIQFQKLYPVDFSMFNDQILYTMFLENKK